MSAQVPLWEGRRGFLRLALVCVLAFIIGLVVEQAMEHGVVEPVCAAHASAHGLVYRGVTVNGPRNNEPGAHCLFGHVGGDETSASLHKVMPFFGSLAIDFLLDIEFTVPLFAVLLAGLTALALRRRRGATS
jgi:hypothetical protein